MVKPSGWKGHHATRHSQKQEHNAKAVGLMQQGAGAPQQTWLFGEFRAGVDACASPGLKLIVICFAGFGDELLIDLATSCADSAVAID